MNAPLRNVIELVLFPYTAYLVRHNTVSSLNTFVETALTPPAFAVRLMADDDNYNFHLKKASCLVFLLGNQKKKSC